MATRAVVARTKLWPMLGAMLIPAFTVAGEPYLGAEAGYSSSNLHNASIVYNGATTSLGGQISGATYNLFVGYAFTPYIAIEAGWQDSNDLNGDIAGYPISGSQTFDGGQQEIKVTGASLDLLGIIPISSRVSAFARAGIFVSELTDNSSYRFSIANVPVPGAPYSLVYYPLPERSNRFQFGLGVKYKLSSKWSIVSDWRRVDMSTYRMNDLDTFSLGAAYRF